MPADLRGYPNIPNVRQITKYFGKTFDKIT